MGTYDHGLSHGNISGITVRESCQQTKWRIEEFEVRNQERDEDLMFSTTTYKKLLDFCLPS